MSIEIVGRFPPRPRVITGFHSLDHAFVNDELEIGFPIGHGNELFGLSFIGKSTFALGLSGIIAREQGENISFADLEGFDRNHLTRIMETVDFNNKIYIPTGITKVAVEEEEEEFEFSDEVEPAPKKRKAKEEKEYDELILDEMIRNLRKDKCCVGILDSIGAISPIAETDGDIGEANMGRRGLVMAQFVRKAMKLCRNSPTPRTVFMLNHWYPRLGGRGYSTPGGEVKGYLTTVQILLKQKETFPDKSYVLEGQVKKNRWGYPNKFFYVFMLAGRGMHQGLSAMYDCLILGKAQRIKSKGIGVKINNEKFTIYGLVKEAKSGNDEIFSVFAEALTDNVSDIVSESEDELDEEQEE